MKKSFRIICLVLAIAFAASMLISIVCSIALADGMDTRGETVYVCLLYTSDAADD